MIAVISARSEYRLTLRNIYTSSVNLLMRLQFYSFAILDAVTSQLIAKDAYWRNQKCQ